MCSSNLGLPLLSHPSTLYSLKTFFPTLHIPKLRDPLNKRIINGWKFRPELPATRRATVQVILQNNAQPPPAHLHKPSLQNTHWRHRPLHPSMPFSKVRDKLPGSDCRQSQTGSTVPDRITRWFIQVSFKLAETDFTVVIGLGGGTNNAV